MKKGNKENKYAADVIVTYSGKVLKSRFTRPDDLSVLVVPDTPSLRRVIHDMIDAMPEEKLKQSREVLKMVVQGRRIISPAPERRSW